jgi:hypothetical protein
LSTEVIPSLFAFRLKLVAVTLVHQMVARFADDDDSVSKRTRANFGFRVRGTYGRHFFPAGIRFQAGPSEIAKLAQMIHWAVNEEGLILVPAFRSQQVGKLRISRYTSICV